LLWLSNVVRASAGGSIIQLLCFAQEEEGQPGAGRTRMRTRKRALTAKTDQQRGALPETLKTWLCTPIPAGSPHKDCSCGPRGRKCRSSRNFEAPAGPNSSLKRTPLPRPRLRYANETQGSDKKRAAAEKSWRLPNYAVLYTSTSPNHSPSTRHLQPQPLTALSCSRRKLSTARVRLGGRRSERGRLFLPVRLLFLVEAEVGDGPRQERRQA